MTDPNGITTRSEYNAFGLPAQVIQDTGGLDVATIYSYDNALNLTSLTDDNSNQTIYTYNERNERIAETYADGTTISFSYDGRGNVLQRVNQDGQTIAYRYDGAGRLLEKTFSTGGRQTFQYDLMSRPTQATATMSGHSSTLDFGYDALGSVININQTVDGRSWAVTYTYDYRNDVYTTVYPSGVQRMHTLDPLSRLDTVRTDGGALLADYNYFDRDSYLTLTYDNGLTTRVDYDPLRRVTRINAPGADYQYGYDAAGNRTYKQFAHKPGGPAEVYRYDALYQLVEAWYDADATTPGNITTQRQHQRYDLDTVGNRLTLAEDGNTTAYLPNDGQRLTNAMHRYEQVGPEPLSYDARGNTLTDGRNTYTYDSLNRQLTMQNTDHTAEYVYDALGRRVAKVVDGVTTYYVYDLNYQVLEERGDDNSLRARYTYGAGIDFVLTIDRGDQTYYYHRDAQNSITGLTDSSGNIEERYEYDVYGGVSVFTGDGSPLTESAVGNPYRYTGRRLDPESGNYYFRARVYSPALGRFLQMDPLGVVDGLNLYTSYFVINGVDPSGLAECDCDSWWSKIPFKSRDCCGGQIYYPAFDICCGGTIHRYAKGSGKCCINGKLKFERPLFERYGSLEQCLENLPASDITLEEIAGAGLGGHVICSTTPWNRAACAVGTAVVGSELLIRQKCTQRVCPDWE